MMQSVPDPSSLVKGLAPRLGIYTEGHKLLTLHTRLTTAEVSSLYNEPLDDTMDRCVQIVQRLECIPSLSLLSSTQTPEVLHCPWAHITEKLEHNPTSYI